MHPPHFMWMGKDDTYDLEEEKAVIQKHYNQAVDVLDGGKGYDTLMGMKDRLEARQSRVEQSASGYKSRRNYARLQIAVMKQKVTSIARGRVEEENGQAVEVEASKILDEPMGAHWKTEDGRVVWDGGLEEVWFAMASGFHPDERQADGEIPTSDVGIRFRPERDESWAHEFNEAHLHATDKRNFSGDQTWRDALDSIRQRWGRLKEQHVRAVKTKELLRFRTAVVETVLCQFESGEIDRNRGVEPPITGYRGAEYAIEAKEVLEKKPITSFSDLEREMEADTVSGGSKVDTVKRNIGYNDLPKEKKGFPRFRELLTEKVKQLRGDN